MICFERVEMADVVSCVEEEVNEFVKALDEVLG